MSCRNLVEGGVTGINGCVRFFAMFTLVFWVGTVHAENGIQEMCEASSRLAKDTMRARQAGVEMSHLMRAFGEGENSNMNKLAQSYVMRAYAYQRVYDEIQKRDLVNEFGSVAFSECFQVLQN
jgi:uncharacterized protein with GYD domain